MEVDHPHPLIRNAFFRLQGVSEFLLVDLCVQSHSKEFVFTEGKIADLGLLCDWGPLHLIWLHDQ